MPSKYYQRIFVKNHYYHIFNRGAYKQKTFLDTNDYESFINILAYYLTSPTKTPYSMPYSPKNTNNNDKSPVSLIAYCLMPNHFHLMLKQNMRSNNKNNITNLMRRLTIAYAMYFNKKYQHSGSLFQGKYKNVEIESEEQFIYLTKYIHRNPLKLRGSEPKKLSQYPYSSYPNYLGKVSQKWLKTEDIKSQFSHINPKNNYKSFVEEKPTSQTKLVIKHLLLNS